MKSVEVILYSAIILFGFSGCATSENPVISPTITKTEVFIPPDKLFECKGVKLPLTFKDNKDVSSLIVEQHSAIKKCKNNINAIKKSLEDAQSKIDN